MSHHLPSPLKYEYEYESFSDFSLEKHAMRKSDNPPFDTTWLTFLVSRALSQLGSHFADVLTWPTPIVDPADTAKINSPKVVFSLWWLNIEYQELLLVSGLVVWVSWHVGKVTGNPEWRMAKGFSVTRDGPKIYSVMLDWTQIIRVTRDRTSQRDAWFAILQARDAWFTRLTD